MDVKLIFGPPGTGKTNTLMDVINFEVTQKRVHPDRIAFVTFTKKGAEEGRSRTAELLNIPTTKLLNFRTLHSMAFRDLNMNRQNMMCGRYYYDFAKKIGYHFSGYYSEELNNNDDKYLFVNDLYRNNKEAGKRMIETMDNEKVLFVMRQYQRYKSTFGYKDFTDLMQDYIDQKKEANVEVVIIDEAQDLTTLQWQMVWTAFRNCKRMYIAGDDDQSIYQWSGADVNYFLNIKGEQEVLKQSYRLPQRLVDYSQKITSQIGMRIEKEYAGQDRKGKIIYVNSLNDIPIDESKSYLCLSRNNVFLRGYEEWLSEKVIPYAVKGEPVISQRDLEAIKHYESIRKTRIMSSAEEEKLSRIRKTSSNLNDPWYDAFNWSESKIYLIRKLIEQKKITQSPKIDVATIHSVKGGEADNVILMEDITQPVFEQLDRDPDSEHRVFYVGVTRAKENLIIVKSQSQYRYRL